VVTEGTEGISRVNSDRGAEKSDLGWGEKGTYFVGAGGMVRIWGGRGLTMNGKGNREIKRGTRDGIKSVQKKRERSSKKTDA